MRAVRNAFLCALRALVRVSSAALCVERRRHLVRRVLSECRVSRAQLPRQALVRASQALQASFSSALHVRRELERRGAHHSRSAPGGRELSSILFIATARKQVFTTCAASLSLSTRTDNGAN